MSENDSSLGHLPEGAWAFDARVTAVFEDMLRRSIPGIDTMRGLVHDLASHYRVPGTPVVDLGASRGDAIAGCVDEGWHNVFELVETSAPMAQVCRERFADKLRGPHERRVGCVVVHEMDLRRGYPEVGFASVTLCVLTLQFTPIEHRLRILRDVWRHTLPSGALILVEKVLGSDAESSETLIKLYHDLKERNGYTREEIDRKAQALEGVLVPVTARWNEDLLRSAGFGTVECFWRTLSFAGWIAVKNG